jgi:hypothetical protein
MVEAGEPAADIVTMCEWIASGYAARSAPNSFAAAHNKEMIELLTTVANQYRANGEVYMADGADKGNSST